MTETLPKVYLARHGETAWTISHQHTGRSDIPLTERGERNAQPGRAAARDELQQGSDEPVSYGARRTAELAGFGDVAEVDPDLMEWDYGRLRRQDDGRDSQGESGLVALPRRLSRRRVGRGGGAHGLIASIARLRPRMTAILLFGHGHFFRVLAARWLGLPAADGRLSILSTASLSVLGYEHSREEPVIRLWNDDRHVTTRDADQRRNLLIPGASAYGEVRETSRALRVRPVPLRRGRLLRSPPGLRPRRSRRKRPTPRERFEALARSIRDLLAQRWLLTGQTHDARNAKQVYYLSMEFLIGRTLANTITNLQVEEFVRERLRLGRRPGLADALRGRARRGAGQWRAGPAGGLLSRLAGDASDSRRSATACATSTACSARRSRTAGRSSIPDNWLHPPDPWEVVRPRRDRRGPTQLLVPDARRDG